MKVFIVLLVCIKLVSSASLRTSSEEDLIAVADEPSSSGEEGHGHGAPGHSDEDHHQDEPHVPQDNSAKIRLSEPIVDLNQTADGTGKPVPVPTKPRLSKVYDAVHNRERRSAVDQVPFEQVSLNCREVVAVGVKDPFTCAKLGQVQLPGDASTYGLAMDSTGQVIGADGKVIFADPLGSFSTASSLDMAKAPGRCRFDPYKAQVSPSTACLCVATSATCTQNRDGCYWFADKKSGNAECISNAERFYDHLYMLLHKRGKKDFAINIRYGGTPARGSLPYGPMGPQIIGQGNPTPTYGMNPDGTASPLPADPSAGLPMSYGTPLDGLPPSASLPAPANLLGYGQPYGLLPTPQPYGLPPPYGMMPPPLPGFPMDPMSYGGLGYPMAGLFSGGLGGSPSYAMPGPYSGSPSYGNY